MGSPTPPRRQTDAAGRASRRGAQLRKSGASGAAQLRRPGTRGAERKARSPRPGAAALWTHMAGGRRPPSLPGPGRTHNLLSLPGGASTARRTVLPSSPRSPTAAEPPGPASGGARRGRQGAEVSRRTRGATPGQPALLRLSGGGSGGALGRRAGRRGSRAEEPICLWQARHAAPPPLRRPALLSPVPSPRARRDPEWTRPGRGRRGPSRRAGRGGREAP
ncbi:unnamed protein product [Rangifer tarandus platyrhynchus]|uniref:Uncharacterized protein n=1 Tax=Rangifer tarandus platyrhynchus TaxID=3082113 RepID=A0ABN8ZX60_RANTA|nr:unnamed protein product [Rangifer tarandus platyrhynchus]